MQINSESCCIIKIMQQFLFWISVAIFYNVFSQSISLIEN